MSVSGSISNWIEGIRDGCESAATMLWRRYHQQLMTIARRRLLGRASVARDEEDVVLDAFHSFLRRFRQGEYPQVRDRHDLWRLLIAITIHKANNQVRDEHRMCRDIRQGAGDESGRDRSDTYLLEHLTSPDPPVELLALVSDSLNRLFSKIPDGELRQMVLYKLDGCTNAEIADKMGRSRATIERRLRLIRAIWREEFDE